MLDRKLEIAGDINKNFADDFSDVRNCSSSNSGDEDTNGDIHDIENLLLRRQFVSNCQEPIAHFPKAPLYLERGLGQYLYDDFGRQYLDLVSSVANVGHCNERVVKSAFKQMSTLNTTPRFLHQSIVNLADKITSSLPDELCICYFVNSGSEANDLATLLARTYTNAKDVMVIEDAFHGQTLSMRQLSAIEIRKHGGETFKKHVHVLPLPDTYRGKYQGNSNDPALGKQYADDAIKEMDKIIQNGRKISMFLAETVMSRAGKVILPPGYIKSVFNHTRKLGGICVLDAVNTGLGRLGKEGFWGFEQHDVIPDILVVGGALGNGHPISCLITTDKIAQSFTQSKSAYYNTFGGNTVSTTIALTVIQVTEDDKLQDNAETVGVFLMEELNKLKEKHTLIGDVRGSGLFIGVDLVKNDESKAPNTDKANEIAYRLKDLGILIGQVGAQDNVLSIQPPLCITIDDAKNLIEKLDQVMTEVVTEQNTDIKDLTTMFPTYKQIYPSQKNGKV